VADRKILIVADEAPDGQALEGRLTKLGYEITAIASSGIEAQVLAAEATPELIVVHMALDGDIRNAGAVNELRGNPKVPVVFLIGEGDEACLRAARVPESHGYIVMPCTNRELRLYIELALAKRDAVTAIHKLQDRFFANSIDLLCFLDFDGHFSRLNPAWERTLGFTREELMSRPFIEFVHPDDREHTLDRNASVRAGYQNFGFENRYRCKDGSYRWFRWTSTSDYDEQIIYGVARDVTESKQAEEERERLLRELQDALAEVKTLRQILPICSFCKKIRDDENYWHTVESYFARHTTTRFSHGICPTCEIELFAPDFDEMAPE
jgi:PAS domain S-box-containing protein